MWFPGKTRTCTDSELVSLTVPGVSPYTLPQGEEFLDSLLTQVNFAIPANWCSGWHRKYFLWPFGPRYQMLWAPSFGNTFAQLWAEINKPWNSAELCSQSSMLAWSQGLLSALSGGRMRQSPLKMQAEQAHLVAKHCQVWAHICRVQANVETFQEPPWFRQIVQENKPKPGWGLEPCSAVVCTG